MKKLLNTLFITSEDAYLTLDGENVVVNGAKSRKLGGFRCTDLAVYSHSRMRAHRRHSWARVRRATLISALCTPRGRFLARACGESNGNVLLRRSQYRAADDREQSCRIARMMIFGKLYNSRWSIEPDVPRPCAMRVDADRLTAACEMLLQPAIKDLLPQVRGICDLGLVCAGLEGAVLLTAYFGVFDDMILGDRETRSKLPRPEAAALRWTRCNAHAVVRVRAAEQRLRGCSWGRWTWTATWAFCTGDRPGRMLALRIGLDGGAAADAWPTGLC